MKPESLILVHPHAPQQLKPATLPRLFRLLTSGCQPELWFHWAIFGRKHSSKIRTAMGPKAFWNLKHLTNIKPIDFVKFYSDVLQIMTRLSILCYHTSTTRFATQVLWSSGIHMLLAALKAISPCPNWKRACPVSTTHASVLEPINDILREGLENWKFSLFFCLPKNDHFWWSGHQNRHIPWKMKPYLYNHICEIARKLLFPHWRPHHQPLRTVEEKYTPYKLNLDHLLDESGIC